MHTQEGIGSCVNVFYVFLLFQCPQEENFQKALLQQRMKSHRRIHLKTSLTHPIQSTLRTLNQLKQTVGVLLLSLFLLFKTNNKLYINA